MTHVCCVAQLFALLSVFASAYALDISDDADFPKFQAFMTKYNRRYATHAETAGRFSIFKDNLKLINKRNSDGGLDKHGVNMFADIHPNEFKSQFTGIYVCLRNGYLL